VWVAGSSAGANYIASLTDDQARSLHVEHLD